MHPNPLRFVLPLPPTMNTYWRHVGRKVLLSAAGRRFKDRCATAAMAQGATKASGEVSVTGTVYMARLGCDLDNRIKPLLDALNGVAWEDDGQVARIDLRRDLDRKRPRVEIELTPLDG